MNLVTIGSAMLDRFIQYSAQHMCLDREQEERFIILEEGKKIEVDHISSSIGGGAVNSACSLAKLGLHPHPISMIGSDQGGEYIRMQLAKMKVNADQLITTDQAETGRSFIIPSRSGNYALLVYRGANLLLRPEHIPDKAIAQADALYVSSLSAEAATILPHIAHRAQANGKWIATNPGLYQISQKPELLIQALNSIDLLITNCYEAHLLLNALLPTQAAAEHRFSQQPSELPKLLCAPITPTTVRFSLVHYFKEIIACGPRLVVVTNGAEGVYVCDGATIYFHPSIPTEMVSTVGAGDAFGSTFFGSLCMGSSIEDAIRSAVLNSASVLTELDTTGGLLSRKTLEKKVAALDPDLLQRFAL